MKIETRNNGLEDCTVIVANGGKVFKRIVSDEILGEEIWLGYSYYIGGELQDPPHLDVPEDFEEVDAETEVDVQSLGNDINENEVVPKDDDMYESLFSIS